MKLFAQGSSLDLSHPHVMGILNVTPDSFSDGGAHNSLVEAVKHANLTIALALAAAITGMVNLAGNFFWWGGGSNRRRDNDNDSGNVLQIVMLIVSILLVILGPIAATLAQMALSRNREYLADAGSVELTRNPQGLISALQKISTAEPMKEADPSSASLYISDPMKKKKSLTHLFDTHPPMDERIDRLEKM